VHACERTQLWNHVRLHLAVHAISEGPALGCEARTVSVVCVGSARKFCDRVLSEQASAQPHSCCCFAFYPTQARAHLEPVWSCFIRLTQSQLSVASVPPNSSQLPPSPMDDDDDDVCRFHFQKRLKLRERSDGVTFTQTCRRLSITCSSRTPSTLARTIMQAQSVANRPC
jgi:hypothetical protein